ncbi:hypothetical protein FQN53_007697 [Emmonsiellopsis sp. PD_33]|nr:hypothetical protein FQN53_007697 [Emmonsiellopsis sp. PD_33]
MPSQSNHKLTGLERIGPKGYLRYVFPFQLQENYDPDEVARVIQAGYEALAQRIPEVAYEAVPDPDANYAELKSRGFPVAAFDGEMICRRSVWPVAAEEPAADFSRAGELYPALISQIRSSFQKLFGKIGNERRYHRAGMREGLRITRSTHFSPSHRREHRQRCYPAVTAANATQSSDQSWVSTNDALSALLWRTVMAAQPPLENLAGDPVSIFNIAIDGRQRTDPKSSFNITNLVIQIQKLILSVGNQFTDDVVTLVAQLEDVDRGLPTAFLDVPGFNCVQTSSFGLGCPVGRQN